MNLNFKYSFQFSSYVNVISNVKFTLVKILVHTKSISKSFDLTYILGICQVQTWTNI